MNKYAAKKIIIAGISDLKGYTDFLINVVGMEHRGGTFAKSGQCRSLRMKLPAPKTVEDVKHGLARMIMEARP